MLYSYVSLEELMDLKENVMRTLVKGIIAGILCLGSSVANATLVTQWEYEVFSEWTGATFSSGGGLVSQDQSEISWGYQLGDHENQAAIPSAARSALVISNSPATGNNMVTGSGIPTLTNIITHWNNTLSNTFKTLVGAELKTTLKLKPFLPVAAGDFLPAKVIDFTIKFTETANSASCGFDSVSVCDDIFVITVGNLSDFFWYDGVKYTTNIIETTLSLTGLSPAACAKANSPAGCFGFKTEEQKATAANFAILIDAEVSEPSGLAILGLSLVGFVLYRRRMIK
jgi:hypothetical protein